jgi:GNAT superfamily N-acetyltransferase
MEEKRIIMLIQRRAICEVIKPRGKPGYFHWLHVKPRYRRQGYALELMKFAIHYTREFLEMDILHKSKVAKRNAARLGYCKIGHSMRYSYCELWKHGQTQLRLPGSRLKLLKSVRYKRMNGSTEVLYLSNSLH